MNTNESLVPAQNGHLIGLSFEGQSVRIIERDGEPWFVLRDVAELLGIGNVSDILARLDDDEKKRLGDIDGIDVKDGLHRSMFVVSESGLYEAIFRSSKPEAKRFRKWIRTEVLPQIRKTGSFVTIGLPAPDVALRLAHLNAEIIAELGSQGTRLRELEAHMRPGPEWLSVNAWLEREGVAWTNAGHRAKLSAMCAHKSGVMGMPVGREWNRQTERRTYSPEVLAIVVPPRLAVWLQRAAAKAATETPELPLP